MLDVLVRVLDHHDRRIDHGADGDGDTAQAHDVGGQPDGAHRQQRQQHGQGERQHGDQRAAEVEEEDDADEADDEALFDQLLAQGGHRVLDQRGAVVGDDQLHPLGERGSDGLADRPLDPLEHVVDALAKADDDDASGGVAQAVVVHHAPADVGTDLHVTHVADADRRPVLLGPQADLLDVMRPP